MKTVQILPEYACSAVIAGCMRIAEMDANQADTFVKTALECGISDFDHADIYGGGKCETVFGKVLSRTPSLRQRIHIQTKCGIVPGKRFDFSYEHILYSVENSLKRLQTDYVDSLLLHRPDTLMEPDEIARAFDKLKHDGKVRHFGVSNCNPMQIELLQRSIGMPLRINQVQFSAAVTGLIDCGLNVNMVNAPGINRDGSLLEYCRLHDITLQAWSPFMYGFFEGVFLNSDKYPKLNQTLETLANAHGATKAGIAVAFILRHPAKWQVVTGTTNPEHMKTAAQGADITLSRQEWYDIYTSAGNVLP